MNAPVKRTIIRKIGLFIVITLLGLAIFRFWFLPDLLVEQMAIVASSGGATPASVGLAFEDASFDVDGDRLEAWFVSPPAPKRHAFLLFHGDGESIADWIPVQAMLFEAGFSSLIFDYAGYGNSEGKPSTRMFDVEPRIALQELIKRVDSQTKVVLLGHSFGAAIAVEAFHDYPEPRVHALIFNSGPPALRDILRDVLGVPGFVTALLPNVINAKSHVSNLDIPVLVISSEADTVIRSDLVLRVYENATEPKQLLLLKESGHNQLTKADPIWWRPILQWVDQI